MARHEFLIVLFTALGLSQAAHTQRPADASKRNVTCPFAGKTFSAGDNWYRVMPTPGDTFCVTCRCSENGKSVCDSKSCTKGPRYGCSEESGLTSMERECCRECHEADSKPKEPEESEEPEVKTCTHSGKVYEDGQVFASNSSGLQVTQSNQCVQCVCSAREGFELGLVLCRVKTCFTDSCKLSKSNALDVSDCCANLPLCKELPAGDEEEIKISSNRKRHLVTFVTNTESGDGDGEQNGCRSGDKFYANGATWAPVIGPLGRMECVRCRCAAPNVQCARLECPPLKPKCQRVQSIPGQCCPVCGSDDDAPDALLHHGAQALSASDEELTKESREGSAQSERVARFCLPSKTDTLVYKNHAQRSISGYYQYAFLTNSSESNVYVYSWSLKEGRVEHMNLQHLAPSDFKNLSSSFRFHLIGATKTKFAERFTKRAKSILEKCVSRCPLKIERLERSLRLKEMSSEDPRACLATEVPFY